MFITDVEYGKWDNVLAAIPLGADVNTRATECGKTALMVACATDAPARVVAALIFFGADVNKTDFHGCNALSYAACFGTDDGANVRILLQRGANAVLRFFRPALFIAVDFNNAAGVRAMLQHGIHWNASHDGVTALTVASRPRNTESHAEIRRLLLAAFRIQRFLRDVKHAAAKCPRAPPVPQWRVVFDRETGNRMEGNFRDGKPHGVVKVTGAKLGTWEHGNIVACKGHFHDGQLHGLAKWWRDDGTTFDTYYVHGVAES